MTTLSARPEDLKKARARFIRAVENLESSCERTGRKKQRRKRIVRLTGLCLIVLAIAALWRAL